MWYKGMRKLQYRCRGHTLPECPKDKENAIRDAFKHFGMIRIAKNGVLSMNERRIQWIDSLRGFGIIIVTFGHLNPWYPLEKHIYSFHMCLFFFISGYLFKESLSLKSFVVKKSKTIMIPFVVWDFLSSLVAIIYGEGIRDTISKFFVVNGQLCWNAPIWFLLVLFIVEVLYAAILSIRNSKKSIIITLIVSVILWILFGSYAVMLKLNLVPLGLFFYALGNMCKQLYEDKDLSKKAVIILIGIFGGASILFGAILNIRISYTGGSFGNIYYCIVAGISGVLFYWLVFKSLRSNKILCELGQNSLIIMATQYWFFQIYDVFSQKLFDISVWNARSTLKAAVVTTVTITLIMVGVSLFKRLFKNHDKILNVAKYIGIR